MDALYPVPKPALPHAARVLRNAFREDPLWTRFFRGVPGLARKLPAFYEVPLRIGHAYGEVLATSADLEGIAAWAPGHLAEMTLWHLVRSGALGPGLRLGVSVARRMSRSFRPIETDRKTHMRGRRYRYLLIIGVAPEHQGQGHGGTLIRGLTGRCDALGEPLYLETETERNAEMYERLGFTLLKRLVLPALGLPLWEMLYEPRSAR